VSDRNQKIAESRTARSASSMASVTQIEVAIAGTTWVSVSCPSSNRAIEMIPVPINSAVTS
jgi:hypothetical protein